MANPQKPLRAALIGISSRAVTSWGARAHLPNFLIAGGRSRYTITAFLNSSVEAAQAAIKLNNLPPTIKAYGNPEELAKDPDVDVVICNTRVDQHYATILPSIRAGKDVFVEWPIAQNMEQIDELVQAARESGSRVAVGLQRRFLPQVLKVKEIVRSGALGKVLSVDVRAFGGRVDRDKLPAGLKYFTDRSVGGNPVTIGVGHCECFPSGEMLDANALGSVGLCPFDCGRAGS
jgi:predicted dehydrogenase